MENYLNQENFNSSEGATFGEYPTSSKTQDFLGDIQTSSQFDQQFTGVNNILSSSTEVSPLESLSGNMGNAQYSSLNETLPFINAVNDYETSGTNKTEVSLEQFQSMNPNITNLTDDANNAQTLPEEYSSLMTQNINSNDQFQNMDIIPSSSSSDVLNTFQTSNYNNEISLGNFQTLTAEINSNNFGEVDNILQGANQGEMLNLPTEYSAETNNNQAFEFNDFKTTSAAEPETSLQFQTTDTISAANIGGNDNNINYLNYGVSTNGFETQSSNLSEVNYDILALSSGVKTNDIGFDTQTNLNVDTGSSFDVNNLGNFDNYQINSSTADTGMSLNDYQNINITTNTTTTGFDAVTTSSAENLQNITNFQTTENYGTFNDTNNLSLNAFQINQNDDLLNPSFNLNEFQTNSDTTSYQVTQSTMESNPTFDFNTVQTSTNIDTFSKDQNYDLSMIQNANPINEITPSFDLNAQNISNNLLDSNQFQASSDNFSSLNLYSSPQTMDMNAYQTSDPISTSFSKLEPATSYNFNNLENVATVDTSSNAQILDTGAIQAISPTVDTTPSFDLNNLQINTTPLVNTASTFESVPKLSNYTNFQNTQVSEIINPSYNFNNQSTNTESILNLSTLSSTKQMTPIMDTNIANSTLNNLDGFRTNIPSSNLFEVSPIQTDNVTFSEYRTTTSVGGVKSKYMPQIEPNFNTSFQQTSVALPKTPYQIFPAKSVILPSTYTKRIPSSMDLSIPKVSFPNLNKSSSMMFPSKAPGPMATPMEISSSRLVPNTFHPSQSELIRSQSFINIPLNGPIITESRVFLPGKKLYSTKTYRAYLNRNEKINQNRQRKKTQNTAKLGRILYKPKYYYKFD